MIDYLIIICLFIQTPWHSVRKDVELQEVFMECLVHVPCKATEQIGTEAKM